MDNGYDVEDFFNVDPLFGTNEELKQMFAKAKELGIKIIMDFVPNHTSDRHQWFQDSINRVGNYTNYYVWQDGLPNPTGGRNLPPNNWVCFLLIIFEAFNYRGFYICKIASGFCNYRMDME